MRAPKNSAEYRSFKNREERIKKLNATTRWLPDSAFTTYFGKPAFCAYGNGNTKPTVGGSVYGQYMLSHNVNPESGAHLPQYQQTYATAALYNKKSEVKPALPRKVNDDNRLNER